MAEPVRTCAGSPEVPGDLARVLVLAAQSCAASAAALAARPDDDPALRAVQLAVALLEELSSRHEVSAAVIEEERSRAVEQDRASRRRFRRVVLPGCGVQLGDQLTLVRGVRLGSRAAVAGRDPRVPDAPDAADDGAGVRAHVLGGPGSGPARDPLH